MDELGSSTGRGQICGTTDLFNVGLMQREFGLNGAGGDASLVAEVVIAEKLMD